MPSKVIVFGSHDSIMQTVEREDGTTEQVAPTPEDTAKFQDACRKIGAKLAEGGYTLIAISDKEEHADRHIVLGAADTGREIPVVVFLRQDNPTAFQKLEESSLGNLKLEFQAHGEEAAVTRLLALEAADVVVVIGGGDGSFFNGRVAHTRETPAVAVGCFAGAGKRLLEAYRKQYQDWGVSGDILARLDGEYGDKTAAAVLDMVQVIEKKQPFAKPDQGLILSASILMIPFVVGLFSLNTGMKPEHTLAILYLGTTTFGGALTGFVLRRLTQADQRHWTEDAGLVVWLTLTVFIITVLGGLIAIEDMDAARQAVRGWSVLFLAYITGLGTGLLPELVLSQVYEKARSIKIFRRE